MRIAKVMSQMCIRIVYLPVVTYLLSISSFVKQLLDSGSRIDRIFEFGFGSVAILAQPYS